MLKLVPIILLISGTHHGKIRRRVEGLRLTDLSSALPYLAKEKGKIYVAEGNFIWYRN